MTKLLKLPFWMALFCALPIFGETATSLDPVGVTEETISGPITSPLQFGLDLKYVPAQYPGVSSARGYGGQIGFEWLPLGSLKHYVGKPAFGVSVAGSHIREFIPHTPYGKLTVYPLSAYFAYRLDFFDNQILVPFAKAARTVSLLSRPLNGGHRFHSWDYSLGAELCLNALDSRSARQLDASSGINNTYVVVEWIKSVSNRGTAQANLSREEWQIGLRFEM
jgi:hypothetical protein